MSYARLSTLDAREAFDSIDEAFYNRDDESALWNELGHIAAIEESCEIDEYCPECYFDE